MRHTITILVAAAFALSASSCKDPDKEIDLTGVFSGPSGKELVAMMFHPDDPDVRRRGVTLLSEEQWGLTTPAVLDGYVTLLETDAYPSVRATAAAALGKAGARYREKMHARKAGPENRQDWESFVETYVPPLIKSVSADTAAAVRWQAATALDRTLEPGADAPEAADALAEAARADESVDVRTAAAAALGSFRDPDSLRVLVDCLGDPAFSVRHEAHASLVERTGRDLGYESYEWTPLLTGDLPPAPEPEPERPWWDWMGVTDDEPADDEPAPQPSPGS